MHFGLLLVLMPAIAIASPDPIGKLDDVPGIALADTNGNDADDSKLLTTSAAELKKASRLLSRFAPGRVPLETAVVRALQTLAQHGERDEISLLRNIADNETREISNLARYAISEIRDRQVNEQRERFARELPNWPELNQRAIPLRKKQGLGREEARCVAYAIAVLGKEPAVEPAEVDGDPWTLLAEGKPRKALGAATKVPTSDARLVEARAREELGDLTGALQGYAWLAANGNLEARASIDGFGVDAERLLLGILVSPDVPLVHEEEEVIDVLVKYGTELSVSVFAERTRSEDSSKAIRAANTLARMLQDSERDLPLTASSRRAARKALVLLARNDNGPGLVASELLETP